MKIKKEIRRMLAAWLAYVLIAMPLFIFLWAVMK